jgi:hypothetical protein
MDLQQRKLTRYEWDSIEIPVSDDEKEILRLIIQGYHDVNIRINKHQSLFSYLKMEYNEKMEDYLYNKYFRIIVEELFKKYNVNYIQLSVSSDIKLKSVDKIRLEQNNIENVKQKEMYEFVLLEHVEKLFKNMHANPIPNIERNNGFWFHYFTLYKLVQNNVSKVNRHIMFIVNSILAKYNNNINMSVVIENALQFIEKNKDLLKYADMSLYEHQKEIFTICKNEEPKLVLYMAPTGTGKTMTPIALSEGFRVIFVCAARHVGLALARAAISMNKKIAFAFGCLSADDIRLHYFAAKVFTKNKRTGGVGKVDNSVGDDVEIMICDIKSYLPAMYYMRAFNPDHKIITYWDEPTITLDYENHEFHQIIQNNWRENMIPNMVLSSATLPKQHEIIDTISDYRQKFENANIYSIISNDCKKTIPIVNKDGYVVLPHTLSENYDDIIKVANHCDSYLTLLRYFDLKEVCDFISYVVENNYYKPKVVLERYFETLADVNMKTIKTYYIELLKNIVPGAWPNIYSHFQTNKTLKIVQNNSIDPKGNIIEKSKSIGPCATASLGLHGKPLTRLVSEQVLPTPPPQPASTTTHNGIYITTKDSFTLTDGPTIYISDDIEKIAKFCIQQSNIPAKTMEDLMSKIEYNNILNEKINALEQEMENKMEQIEKRNDTSSNSSNSTKDIRKFNRDASAEDGTSKSEIVQLTSQINSLRSMTKSTCLNDTFVPNKYNHLKKWADGLHSNAFTSNIDESIVNDIMLLHGVKDSWKVLLMMGIGVFTNHENITYTEIMKKMADDQKLYLIIASSDYIYGTNYQFCHGYLSKDLNLTQEKIIQAMGRIGRNNVQQNYTIRFRDDAQIMKLFTADTDKPEIRNMNKLFNSNVNI